MSSQAGKLGFPMLGACSAAKGAVILLTQVLAEEPEEVASVIAFLFSDDARYVTGEAVNVSGGQTMA